MQASFLSSLLFSTATNIRELLANYNPAAETSCPNGARPLSDDKGQEAVAA
jgi:hypothetical protein